MIVARGGRSTLHLARRRRGGEAEQERQERGQIPPADPQGLIGIDQHPRNGPQHTGRRQRHDAPALNEAGIPEGAAATRLVLVDEGDAMSFPLKIERRTDTDRTCAEDRDVLAGHLS